MLTDPTTSLVETIKAKLLGDADLAALVADRCYDRIPNNPTFPYLSIGEVQVLPELGEATDAATAHVTLHSWDRFKGSDAVRSIGKYVIAALHDQDLMLSDGAVQSLLLESARTLPDPDGLTKHGVYQFAILTDANA
ncbi:DUF3168 domain-containing protein [Bradyrhizobium sp. SRS-191]|uniref:DUF3168 domain-containing protein n=1 Tax=Bradyrhizobium sp. SRS-191 TaxID=2962606 RepID=UPI00211E0DAB|nr:DUF3168 domain-containing protein [Bradyrhizobium sp. SRS-191]